MNPLPSARILTGIVLPMTTSGARAEAVGISGGSVAAIGSVDEVRAAVGPDAPVTDYADRAILPGFIDAHHHFSLAAFDAEAPDLHLADGATIAEMLERIAAHASANTSSRWLRVQGYDLHKLRERRPPTRQELDVISPDRPLLVIAYSFHEGILNGAGLEELGWSDHTPDPENGWLTRHRGRLSGEIGEAAFFLAEAQSRSALAPDREEQWLAACEAHGRSLLRAGITRVGDPAVSPDFDRLYELAVAGDRLPVTVHRFPVSSETILSPSFDRAPSGSGPSRAPLGPMKLILDGADRCAVCFSTRQALESTATALARSVRLRRFSPLRTLAERSRGARLSRHGTASGLLFHQAEESAHLIARARHTGLQVAQHAIGNRAIDVALGALAATARSAGSVYGPSRIEHFLVVDPAHLRRAYAVGAVPVVQPIWLTDMGTRWEDEVVPRPLTIMPLRSMLDAGLRPAASSDYPVAGFDVMAGLFAAVTRTAPSGAVLAPRECVTVEEALAMYTSAAAHSLGVDDQVGQLRPGMRADVTVVSHDPTAVEPTCLPDICVEQVYIDGVPQL